MELIFGFLPLPIAVVALVTIGIGGFLVRKYVKNPPIVAVATAITDAVITKERVDQTVEAVLAKLKVDPSLADKIGDYVADLILEILQHASERALARRNVIVKKAIAAAAFHDATQIQDAIVLSEIMNRPNLLMDTIKAVAPTDVIQDPAARLAITKAIVTKVVGEPVQPT